MKLCRPQMTPIFRPQMNAISAADEGDFRPQMNEDFGAARRIHA